MNKGQRKSKLNDRSYIPLAFCDTVDMIRPRSSGSFSTYPVNRSELEMRSTTYLSISSLLDLIRKQSALQSSFRTLGISRDVIRILIFGSSFCSSFIRAFLAPLFSEHSSRASMMMKTLSYVNTADRRSSMYSSSVG